MIFYYNVKYINCKNTIMSDEKDYKFGWTMVKILLVWIAIVFIWFIYNVIDRF